MSNEASFKLKVKGPSALISKIAAKQTINPKATKAYVRKKV